MNTTAIASHLNMEKSLDLSTLDELPSLKNFDSYQAMTSWLKANGLTFSDYEKELVRRRRIVYEAKKAQRNQAQRNQMVAPTTVTTIFDKDRAFAATVGMMQTSTGDWVTADEWDEIEGDM